MSGTKDLDEVKAMCVPIRDDYFECLHHKKEVRILASDGRMEWGEMWWAGEEGRNGSACNGFLTHRRYIIFLYYASHPLTDARD